MTALLEAYGFLVTLAGIVAICGKLLWGQFRRGDLAPPRDDPWGEPREYGPAQWNGEVE